ncbi:hypothetical protein AC1031_008956 [Aphanomyces cochlioides]|nr:hypothetical protein AC1031_008956 [Aphanomyces cochlioides]
MAETNKITISVDKTVAICVLVVMGIIVAFIFLSTVCHCLRGSKKKPRYSQRVVMFDESIGQNHHDYLDPFLDPPDYEQPHGELKPPAYHELPSAPPFEHDV